ncbi:hypothetical protein B0T24DRAFT_714477 [Lasiosphaeria ovina]|uniref:Uncharacterized protein n=1 Tax=Lasiosphaeria ovina TaxID=92902 RepID=A0AAE0NIY5_9PEZI|nr:hypothetical protein B0T24DRAFT_714477 [Lasiosphaeria ovina]
MPDKDRIYFSVYFQQGEHGTLRIPRVFHCDLWVQPKNSIRGYRFHVRKHVAMYSNLLPHQQQQGWVYETTYAANNQGRSWVSSNQGIGRILIGKLPDGIGASDVEGVARMIPLPDDSKDEDCWTWAGNLIKELQRQRWIPSFSWTTFRQRAYAKACQWYEENQTLERDKRQTWDMFELEKGCTVM